MDRSVQSMIRLKFRPRTPEPGSPPPPGSAHWHWSAHRQSRRRLPARQRQSRPSSRSRAAPSSQRTERSDRRSRSPARSRRSRPRQPAHQVRPARRGIARSDVVCPSAAKCRRSMPERERIHSSDVSQRLREFGHSRRHVGQIMPDAPDHGAPCHASSPPLPSCPVGIMGQRHGRGNLRRHRFGEPHLRQPPGQRHGGRDSRRIGRAMAFDHRAVQPQKHPAIDLPWINPLAEMPQGGHRQQARQPRQKRPVECLAQRIRHQFRRALAGLQRDIAVNPSVTITSTRAEGRSPPSTKPHIRNRPGGRRARSGRPDLQFGAALVLFHADIQQAHLRRGTPRAARA